MRYFAMPLFMLISACGFNPVYEQRPSQLDTRYILQSIAIKAPQGREGDALKAALEDQFYQSLSDQPARYVLQTDLLIDAQPFIIDPDGISSRFDLILTSNYQLTTSMKTEILHQGTLRRKVSYNVSEDDDYATYIAQLDARNNGIKALAKDYALRMGNVIATAMNRP